MKFSASELQHLENLRLLANSDVEKMKLVRSLQQDLDALGEEYFVLLHAFINPLRQIFLGKDYLMCDVDSRNAIVVYYCIRTVKCQTNENQSETLMLKVIRDYILDVFRNKYPNFKGC